MRVALLQGPVDGTPILDQIEAAACEAARQGAGLLVCPEMVLTGYALGPERARALAEPAEGPAAARAARIARMHGIALVYGFPELAGGAVHNSAILIDRAGATRLVHRKAHLYGDLDRGMFAPGAAIGPVVELDGIKVGLLICYDVEFPEAVRRLALAGADLIAVPTALMAPYQDVASRMVPVRAWESQVFIAYANRADREGDLDYCGLSCLVGPDGIDIARAGTGPQLLVAEFDPKRSRADFSYLTDRRAELY